MILLNKLNTNSWYKGFHEKAHVAQWNGHTFVTLVDGLTEYLPHITEEYTGFEPTEEIHPLPESLRNENQIQKEIDDITDYSKGIFGL